jgi:hypothetical protein
VARNICRTTERCGPSGELRAEEEKEALTASDIEEMTNKEQFGFLSSPDDGDTAFANIPSGAVTWYFCFGLGTLPENDNHLGAGH